MLLLLHFLLQVSHFPLHLLSSFINRDDEIKNDFIGQINKKKLKSKSENIHAAKL
jgi:hypothetical protein